MYLKTNYPGMSSSVNYRQLRDNGSMKAGDISESTGNRFVNVISIQLKTTTNQDMRRYERPHINEVWCGDSSVGPCLTTPDGKKHQFRYPFFSPTPHGVNLGSRFGVRRQLRPLWAFATD